MRSQKNCYYLIDAEVISFVVASKDKKSKKLTKIVTIEEVKIHIFRKTWWMSMKFSGKNVTYDIKSDEKQSFKHWNIFFRLRRGFSLNETSILLFCQISNISFYLNKNDIRKNCQENHLVKVVKRYSAWCMLFGICPRTLLTPKFWHMYVMTYGNFMVIVEPWWL